MPSDWGKERIRKLSLFKTVMNAILSNFEFFKKLSKETSLIDEFYYPKLGCSQLWNLMADYIVAHGGQILLNHEVIDFEVNENKMINAKVKYINGKIIEIQGDYFASSMPICDLIKGLDAPYNIKQYALNLPYRDYLLVSFYTKSFNLKNQTNYRTVNNITPECWIYLQEPDAVASRIQIMNNWSPYLVGDFKRNYLISLEYYVNEDEFLWNLDDGKIIELALNECKKYNLFYNKDVLKAKVIREKKAYPAYWGSYHKLNEIKKYIATINNLYLIGRNGQHKYNNMDEAMLSGIDVAREIIKKLGK